MSVFVREGWEAQVDFFPRNVPVSVRFVDVVIVLTLSFFVVVRLEG